MKCEFCGKEYKTEKGLEKHLLNCKVKQRLEVYNTNTLLKYNFVWFSKYFYPFGNKKVKDKDLPLFYCQSKYFDKLYELTKLEQTVELYTPEDYFNYLYCRKIKFTEWALEKHLLDFLYDWSYNEPLDHAIYRSKKYLENHNWTLETISPYNLFLALRYGNISFKYIKSVNFDWKKNIECESEEIAYLKYFLRD